MATVNHDEVLLPISMMIGTEPTCWQRHHPQQLGSVATNQSPLYDDFIMCAKPRGRYSRHWPAAVATV